MNENNKLIAKFMGGNYISKEFFNNGAWDLKEHHGYQPILYYNFSWDWLIPVIDKIESLNFIVEIKQNTCIIKSSFLGNKLSLTKQIYNYKKEYTKLSNTYKSVIEFINWYNKINNEKKNF